MIFINLIMNWLMRLEDRWHAIAVANWMKRNAQRQRDGVVEISAGGGVDGNAPAGSRHLESGLACGNSHSFPVNRLKRTAGIESGPPADSIPRNKPTWAELNPYPHGRYTGGNATN